MVGEIGERGEVGETMVAARGSPGLFGGFGVRVGCGLLVEEVSDVSDTSLMVGTICAPVEACPTPLPS